MDFLDPKKKRANLRRLYAGYALMAIVLAFLTYFLVYATYGFDIDRRTGSIIQNGLIVVDSHPESASIKINGASQGNTLSRLVLPAGDYNVLLQRVGYRDWGHKVSLEGSSIEQLTYPILFPTRLITKTIQEYNSVPGIASESPDHRWLFVQPQLGTSAFNVIDLTNNKNTITTLMLPPEIIGASDGASSFEAVEWSSDNVHLLLKHTIDSATEFILFDRTNPAASININKLFADQQFSSVSLRDKKPDQLYLHSSASGNLLTADMQTKAVNLSVSGVISYKSYQSDTLVYISNPAGSTNAVELHISQNKNDFLLRILPISSVYLFDMAQFNGSFYVTAGSAADGHVYVYKDPFNDFNKRPVKTPLPSRVLIVPGAEYVSFSIISRIIAVQGGSNFAIYDIENNRQFRYDIKLPVAPHQKAGWMDGHRLSLISEDKVNIFDFDGLNKQALSPGLATLSPFFNRDYTAMFTIAPTANAPDKATLTRTELKALPASQTSP